MITSKSNQAIKQYRKLLDRKERQQTGLALVEGVRIVIEAVSQGMDIDCLIVAPDLLTSPAGKEAVFQMEETGVTVIVVSAPVFQTLAQKDGPQGIAAVIRQRWETLDRLTLTPGALWVALDSVQDPGNLGTILRTLDAVGGAGVILLDHSTDPYSPTALRASMGAAFSQKLVKTTTSQFVEWKQNRDITVIGTSGDSNRDYHLIEYPDPLVVLMGSERQGLKPEQMEICDSLVRIPMIGQSDSLNLSVATAVVLYEVFNQRRKPSDGGWRGGK